MKHIRKYIFEEETAQDTQTEQPQPVQQNAPDKAQNSIKIKLAQEIANINNLIFKKKKEYDLFKNQQLEKIAMLRKQAADKGIDLNVPIVENVQIVHPERTVEEHKAQPYSFSKKLYESILIGKIDELTAIFTETFNSLDTLSYYPDIKECKTLARKFLTWINEQNWTDKEDHWEEVEDKTRFWITKGTGAMSKRETDEFIEKFKEVLMQSSMFSWVFGK